MIIQIAGGSIIALLGFLLSRTYGRIDSAHTELGDVRKEMTDLALQLAKDYIRRDDFQAVTDAIFKKLDRIEDKLDGKADKP
ncbi:hypothetical protein [Ralstonia condita]|nr:hypothetical protein [Ralstonia sp. LMG 7141]